jgi:hypothetical protein
MSASRNVKATTVTVSCGRKVKAVQVPVLWSLSHGLANQTQALRDQVKDYQRRADEHGRNDTFFNRVGSFLKNEDSERRKQIQNLARATEKLAELRPLESRATDLAAALARAQRKYGLPRALRKADRLLT